MPQAASMTGRQSVPRVSTPARGSAETGLEQLKQRLLMPILAATEDFRLAEEIRWAALEAAALAWITPFPFLVFPCLLEEKVKAAKVRWQRQREIRHRSPAPLLVSMLSPGCFLSTHPAQGALKWAVLPNVSPSPCLEPNAAPAGHLCGAPLRRHAHKGPARPAGRPRRSPGSNRYTFGPPTDRR
jgi:hypothetical protein